MRARDKILANLEVIYRESFDRAKEATDQRRMADLDNAYQQLADSGATVVTTLFPDVARMLPVRIHASGSGPKESRARSA